MNHSNKSPTRAISVEPMVEGSGRQVTGYVGALLTQKEVARKLRVSLSSVRRYTAAGMLPYVKFETGPVRYRFEDIEEFIKSHVRVSSIGSSTYLPQHGERGS